MNIKWEQNVKMKNVFEVETGKWKGSVLSSLPLIAYIDKVIKLFEGKFLEFDGEIMIYVGDLVCWS